MTFDPNKRSVPIGYIAWTGGHQDYYDVNDTQYVVVMYIIPDLMQRIVTPFKVFMVEKEEINPHMLTKYEHPTQLTFTYDKDVVHIIGDITWTFSKEEQE